MRKTIENIIINVLKDSGIEVGEEKQNLLKQRHIGFDEENRNTVNFGYI